MKNPHKGSDFDKFLKDEDLLDQVEARAVKRVISYPIAMPSASVANPILVNYVH